MKKKSTKGTIKKALIISVILLIIIICTIIIIKSNAKNSEVEENKIVTIEEEKESDTRNLKSKNEKERMQYYLARYLKYIERKEYEQAYNLLYEEFKTNYFSTLEKYIKYVKMNYSTLMQVEYEDIERQGVYYILTVKITDLENTGDVKEQKFIIREDSWNDFKVSFQAK